MGRGRLGSTGPCFKLKIGSRTNQVPRPLSSLSQQSTYLELTHWVAAPGLFGVRRGTWPVLPLASRHIHSAEQQII